MRIFLALFILGHALAGVPHSQQLTAQINADKLKHNDRLLPIVVQQKTPNVPGSGVRILRQQPAGYQYQQPPTPSFFLPTQASNQIQAAVTLPQQLLPASTAPPPTLAATTYPATAYLPPSTPQPTTAAPPQVIIVEPIRPVTIPAFIAPATTAPITLPPVTQPTILSFPPRPTVGPVVIDPPAMNMALMPQLPTVQMAQIASLNVDCAKESMLVKIKFDRPFGGLIYSKGFHSNLDCHYVRYGSNRDSYEFLIRLESCGSQWVDALASGGQAYLENVIIIQNEPGIQEIWDTSRSIRCFWEGSLEKTVSYAFNIDMLDTQIVSFSGDSATASMDIQIVKGPNAPSVNGLVKIGDTLTMVVAIEGDPGFDVQVQECIAHDGDRANAVTLTDKSGCVLKKKLMGPWQKTTQTGRPEVSLVAFSFFQAFKFPDQMEVFLECNVELCKNGCDVCPEDASLFDIRSNRRRRSANNATCRTPAFAFCGSYWRSQVPETRIKNHHHLHPSSCQLYRKIQYRVHALKSLPQPFSPGISPIHPTTFNPATTTTVSSPPKIALVEGNVPVTIPAVITPVESYSIPHARSVNSNPLALTYPPSRNDGPAADDPVDTNKALMPQSSTLQMAQIISLDVDCAKESMLVKIKFDCPFNGLIYSKGFHSNLDCHHVRYGTNRDFYEFTIRLDTCGSLTSGKKAYLENVIIIQNQKGIQEIRDISRSICCFWEGLLNKTVSYAFNIDMLDTKNVSFSGDSATASMDVQIGKGPNAPSVNGQVKIGDILTMVVAIEGEPGFDFRVQECIAHDGNRANAITLSDKNNGCVVMNKLMGPWQKTTRTDLSFIFRLLPGLQITRPDGSLPRMQR